MKTRIQILMGAAVAALLTISSVNVNAAVKLPAMESLTLKTDVKKVVVKGNVRVTLMQGNREWVTMDENDMDKVSVSQFGDILTISSNETEPINVIVHVNDIYRIDASDNAVVNTQGNLKLQNLQIFLRDQAVARVNTVTESLYTLVDNDANLVLRGSTESHTVNYAALNNVNMTKFTAAKTNKVGQINFLAMQ